MAGSLAPVTDAHPDPPPCERCGKPLGVYEPLFWRRPDGTSEVRGWLAIREHPEHAHPLSAFFHADCAVGAAT